MLGASFPSKVCFRWGKTRYCKFVRKLILISLVVEMKMFLSPKAYYLPEQLLGISHHISLSLNPSKTLLLKFSVHLPHAVNIEGRRKVSVQCGSVI